ncbi:hypothetical protein ACEQ8H_002440 [Pleosporales sp. CAS-2024a]
MANDGPKKGGFRALFRGRSGEPNPRKKLSKKASHSLPSQSQPEKLGTEFVANSQRQDSGSFTRPSLEQATERRPPPDYDAVIALSGQRDSPYAATSVGLASTLAYATSSSVSAAEYRRNSEGLQQYATPLYRAQSSPSNSTRQFSNHDQREGGPASPSKASPAKLTKTRRIPKPDELLDKDTGERKDVTDMMHAFTFDESMDTLDERVYEDSLDYDASKPDGTAMLGGVSPEVWLHIASFLSALDVCNLSSTCRTMYTRLGSQAHRLLLDPANRRHRLDFLLAMDHKLPSHLFCFPCAQWHLRIQPGMETLKPHHVLNPLFDCPNRTNMHRPPPRVRISEGRMLPFAFVQLARRSWAFGPEFGIQHQTLARRWKDPSSSWIHESMYHITDKGHVMMRIKSHCYVEGGMTAAAKRLLLFSRDDYTPYFSVCSHWKDGLLTSIPKCALDHIPFVAVPDAATQLKAKVGLGNKPIRLITLCNRCRPMRRCPACPTEYLFELKLVEDKSVPNYSSPQRFKHALIATRWSDLGPARSPHDKEWAAIAGHDDYRYDSFIEIGRRAVSGVFEGAFTDNPPGQRILSMNPKMVKADELGGDWY